MSTRTTRSWYSFKQDNKWLPDYVLADWWAYELMNDNACLSYASEYDKRDKGLGLKQRPVKGMTDDL